MAGNPSEPLHGFVVWIEGLPGSGKTTLSKAVAQELGRSWRTEILDGEEVRQTFFPELGYSRKDREHHARRVSHLAQLLARHGAAVVVAMITPYETSRQAARAAVSCPFLEVWLRCPIEVCEQRDPHGIYRRTHEGVVRKVTGVDDPFEEPLNPDLIVDTASEPVDACTRRILEGIRSMGLVSPMAA